MSKEVCNNRCAACFFFGRSTGTCDYIFIVGQRRMCDPGEKCTAFVSHNRKDEFMARPKWNTELGHKMWLEGKKDYQIAESLGISVHAVTQYRLKHWQNDPAKNESAKPAGALQKKEKVSLHGTHAFNFNAGLQVPTDPAATADPAPAGEKNTESVAVSIPVPERKLDIMDILEAATGHLTGMKAVCTAGAIQHLMYWRYPEDLLRARDHIDYLLDLLQKREG